ncbi:autophagy-related protein 16-1-like isoform X2 [Lycorma delicatula]|uniref:autophagy-related protein 16-1-like isoform X2 n=1 Tax=Lycorma delicatula TaxID=130591 RepID=UPI003F50D92F
MAVDGDLFSQSDWRKSIILQLQKRNREQSDCFHDLITSHNRLFDNWTALRHENLQLSIQNEKLRLEGGGSTSSNSGLGVNEAKIAALEQKLLSQQEELTDLHKRRGENAQLLIDLNHSLKEKENQISVLEDRLSQSVAECISLRAEIELYKSNAQNLEELNLHLKDEHQALHLEFVHIEDKLRKTQDENSRLLERLMKYKSKDAEKLNEENENFLRHRNAKMQKELEDAAKDTRGLSPEQLQFDYVGPSLVPAVPTKAAIKFADFFSPSIVSGFMETTISKPRSEGLQFRCTFYPAQHDAHDGEVNAVRWSPIDRIVATGGADRKLKLWDVSKGVLESKGMLVGSNAGIMSVDFDSTGTLILGASNDFATRVWTVVDQRLRGPDESFHHF